MSTVLVVDDSTAIRRAICRILEPLGFGTQEAGNGVEALAFFRAGGTPDAVLLDIDMPQMDGLSFLKALRTDSGLPQPRVVMCTTHTAVTRIQEALTLGADEFIMKPFDADMIAAKLEAVGVAP